MGIFNFNQPKIRLRFAPSPTGFLHIGSLRSALFGYLLAKSQKGKFLLRIEDTDQKREVEGATESLIRLLGKLGLEFDEGPHKEGKYGPYIQSQRLDIYHKYADKLLAEGKIYPCFCTPERLEEMRQEQSARHEPPRYDRRCLHLSQEEAEKRIKAGEKYVLRQKMPLEGEVKVYDEIRGEIVFPAADLEDHVLIKSDGVPTYQFANVVDDHLMEISHVTRAAEWLPSFPKNILLYQAFGWRPPKFIHMPLILNQEGGGKLSKRRGDVFVEDFLAKGYLKEGLINFCALLGWHPKDEQEIFSLEELEEKFSLSGMGASPAVFDTNKLDFFNAYYIRRQPLTELAQMCRPYLDETDRDILEDKWQKFISLAQERMTILSQANELTAFLFKRPEFPESLLAWKQLEAVQAKANLAELTAFLEGLGENDWTKEALERSVLDWIKARGGKNGDYLWPMRVALTGLKNSPGPFETAWALGREESLKRLRALP